MAMATVITYPAAESDHGRSTVEPSRGRCIGVPQARPPPTAHLLPSSSSSPVMARSFASPVPPTGSLKRVLSDQPLRPAKKRRTRTASEPTAHFLPFDSRDIKDYEDVEWITSHLSPKVVLWSNDPAKVKPNVDLSLVNEREYEKGSDVVNTWFVDSPTPSSAQIPAIAQYVDDIATCTEFLRKATAVLIVAGAGLGVDSGLPDYRGPQGFWKAYPALQARGLSLEDMSHPQWFMQDPHAAWGFYAHRAHLYHSATPHAGFGVLRAITETKKGNYFVFTSNIDSQFQAAGFDEDRIYEAHGNLSYLQCVNTKCHEVWFGGEQIPPSPDSPTLELPKMTVLPRCPHCNSLARPNVSMFGDTNCTWKDSRSVMQKHFFLRWLRGVYGPVDGSSPLRNSRDEGGQLVILEIGCGLSVHSLRLEVEMLLSNEAPRSTVRCIRINPHAWSIREPHVGLPLGSLAALEAIASCYPLQSLPIAPIRRATITAKAEKVKMIVKSEPKRRTVRAVHRLTAPADGCFCGRERKETQVQCSACDHWFHLSCVFLEKAIATALPQWWCDSCKSSKITSRPKYRLSELEAAAKEMTERRTRSGKKL